MSQPNSSLLGFPSAAYRQTKLSDLVIVSKGARQGTVNVRNLVVSERDSRYRSRGAICGKTYLDVWEAFRTGIRPSTGKLLVEAG